MTEPAGDATGGRVLLKARTDALKSDMTRRYWSKFAVTEYPDRVEYTDGKRIKRWRLADQPGDEPILDTALVVLYPNVVGGRGSADLVFLDPDGQLLSHFNPRGAVPLMMTDLVLPEDVYAGLRARGVTVREQKYSSTDLFYQEHPDPNASVGRRHLQQHLAAYVFLLIFLIVVVVIGVMALNGSFSS